MIKLARPLPPAELTAQIAQELTAKYMLDRRESVWNENYIRQALLTMSHGKCAYCEARLDEGPQYMEVDHLYCRNDFPNRVVEWANLLPSCKRCNSTKATYNIVLNGDLVDPTVDDPREHLTLKNFRIYGRDEKGERTEYELGLNEPRRLGVPRFKVANAVAELLDEINQKIAEAPQMQQPLRSLRNSARKLQRVFEEAQPSATFSAVTATLILTHQHYSAIREELRQAGLWTAEFDALEAVANSISLAA